MSKKIRRLAEQVYYPQTIPDRTEELIKLSREAQIRQRQENLEEKRRGEDVKNARILASREDKYLHAINLIIEHAGAAIPVKNLDTGISTISYSIPYHFFNFENHTTYRNLLETFLSKLKEAGCFEDFFMSTHFWDTNFGFLHVDIHKLMVYKEQLTLFDNNRIVGSTSKKWKKRDLKKELTRVKKIAKLGHKELDLLTILFDLQPHKLKELKISASRNALKQLKRIVNKKISATGWVIKHEGNEFNSNSCYTLQSLTK